MAKKSVINYIKEQLQKGYDISAIRNIMLKYGYSNKDIDDAIKSLYQPTIRHEIHLSHTTIFVILFVVVSLIGTGFFLYYNSGKSPEKLLDLNLEPVTTTAVPGQSITFVKELSNLGSQKRYDVVIKQELIDTKTFKAVTEKTETRAIETFGSTQTNMQVPQDAKPGDYILRVTIDYDGKRAIATLPVKITASQQPSCFDGIKNQNEDDVDCGGICEPCKKISCNDNNPCTSDTIQDSKCVNKPITPCCGNNICEANEQQSCSSDCKKEQISELPSTPTLDEIKDIAKSNPSKALQECDKIEVPNLKDTCIANIAEAQNDKSYCTKIIDARIKDLCYSNIAKAVNDNSLCQEIATDSIRDSCYMRFMLDNKDYSVCGQITNKQLRQSCESLRQLNALNQQAQQT